MRNIGSSERYSLNSLKSSHDESMESHHVRKKFFRHQKRLDSSETGRKRIEIPEHEFEEKFEVPPPPKNITDGVEDDRFKNWFFLDNSKDLDAMESYVENNSEVRPKL